MNAYMAFNFIESINTQFYAIACMWLDFEIFQDTRTDEICDANKSKAPVVVEDENSLLFL
jgi:hypothetical protein